MSSRSPPLRDENDVSHRKLFGLALVVVFCLVALSLLLFSLDGPATGQAFFGAESIDSLELSAGEASLAFADIALEQGDLFAVAVVAYPFGGVVDAEPGQVTDFRMTFERDPAFEFLSFESLLADSWEVTYFAFDGDEAKFTYGTDKVEDSLDFEQVTLGYLWFAVRDVPSTGTARISLPSFEMYSTGELVAQQIASSRDYIVTKSTSLLPPITIEGETTYSVGETITLDASSSVDVGSVSYSFYEPSEREFSLPSSEESGTLVTNAQTIGTRTFRVAAISNPGSGAEAIKVGFKDVSVTIGEGASPLDLCLNVPEFSEHCLLVSDVPTEPRESVLVESCGEFGVPSCTYTCIEGFAYKEGACVRLDDGINSAPSAVITSTSHTLPLIKVAADAFPLSVDLSAQGSEDVDGSLVIYSWIDRTAGSESVFSSGIEASYTVSDYGIYTLELQVVDDEGGVGKALVDLEVVPTEDESEEEQEDSLEQVSVEVFGLNDEGDYVSVDQLTIGKVHRIVVQAQGPLPEHLFVAQLKSKEGESLVLHYERREELVGAAREQILFEYVPESDTTYTVEGFVWESWPASGGAVLAQAGSLVIAGVE